MPRCLLTADRSLENGIRINTFITTVTSQLDTVTSNARLLPPVPVSSSQTVSSIRVSGDSCQPFNDQIYGQ